MLAEVPPIITQISIPELNAAAAPPVHSTGAGPCPSLPQPLPLWAQTLMSREQRGKTVVMRRVNKLFRLLQEQKAEPGLCGASWENLAPTSFAKTGLF